MYGFDDRLLVQDEAHRAACLDWIDNQCKPLVEANPDWDHFDEDELDRLEALREMILRAPVLAAPVLAESAG
jgi:hypothetical protein